MFFWGVNFWDGLNGGLTGEKESSGADTPHQEGFSKPFRGFKDSRWKMGEEKEG